MNQLELAKSLRNIGPVTALQLINAGIDSPEKLKTIGAKEAFMRIHQSNG